MEHGFAFSEHIKTDKIKKHRYEEGVPLLKFRSMLLPLILIVVAVVFMIRLFYLQIIHGQGYKELADYNRTRTVVIHAPRGVIFDRNGEPLVYNIPGFRQITRDKKTIHLSREEALKKIAKGDQRVEIDSLRQYPFKDAMAHVLGYIGQISEEELKTPEFASYPLGDWIGKSGIERQYERLLRGIDGRQLIEVDAMGKPVRYLGQTDPIPGNDITLTIDAKLQKAAFDAASDVKKGAIVVSTPTGEILAMVSKPSFDPNLFTLDETYRATDSSYPTVESIIGDTQSQPLLDRAISGVYPPGSTFKIVTAISGLENKVIDEDFYVTDTGVLKVGDFSFANWYFTQYGRTEGEVNVVKAISRSNDIFFYKLGQMVGVDKLSETAKKFGLGSALGIDLDGEVTGLVPTKEWKKKTLNEDWYLGDSYHYGIGQGYLLTTPLQVNSWTQVVANGGTLYQPRLLLNHESRIMNHGLLSKKNLSLIREGMMESCSKGGVAWPLFDFRIKNQESRIKVDGKNFIDVASSDSAKMTQIVIACKTGTAQHGGDETLPHAWITLFAPAYDPEIVVTVLAESSGEGSNIAAPIAKKILEAYFGNK